MNIKETNKRLTSLKTQYLNMVQAITEIEDECVALLGYAPDNDLAAHYVIDYLNGFTSQKDLRPAIERAVEKANFGK